jgi:hypothetical protein
VDAISAHDVWAVGRTGFTAQPLAFHWNGTKWRDIRTPSFPPGGGDAVFESVSAQSATNAWAVGSHGSKTLIERWNGHAWSVKPSVDPGQVQTLSDIAGTAGDLWAVGRWVGPGHSRNLVEHWDGAAWTVADVPDPGTYRKLSGVTVSSAGDVWAVGQVGGHLTEILRTC